MTTVSQVNPIKVYFNPSEQEYLAWVAKHGPPEKSITADQSLEKGPLELILSDGTVFPHRGKPFLVGREVDVKTGTIQLVGVFPNPGNLLRPGQYAKVRVAVDVKKGAILVPQRAVNELQGSYQVAVVGADNKATIKVVTVGPRDGNLWVIEKGLKPGDRIVVEGIQRVRSGMTVAPKEAAAAARPATAGADARGGRRNREVDAMARILHRPADRRDRHRDRHGARRARRDVGAARSRSSRTSSRRRSRSRRPTRAPTRSRSSSRWRRRSSSR